MNALPVIRRELRAQARQPLSYWARALAVAAMLGATLLFAVNNDFSPGAGVRLLTYLHGCLFLSIWVFVPALTADCLSRERREGTLSLLFLTHLKPFDIVLAKTSAHTLRAFTLWLATLPTLTLPFLMGGAGWQHALLSVLFNFMALCLALGAGVLASSRCRSWARAIVSSLCMALVFLLSYSLVNGAMLFRVTGPFVANPAGMVKILLHPNFAESVFAAAAAPEIVSYFAQYKGAIPAVLRTETWMTLPALCFLGLCLQVAARNLAKHWRDETPSARAQWVERMFCTPIIGVSLLRRWLRRTLERNQVGWLEQRTWTGRTLMWGWLAVVTSVYMTIFSGGHWTAITLQGMQGLISWGLAVSLAFTAAGSFRRERENGVLELLLVSPTSTWQLLSGRVRGLWGQFWPALTLLFSVWLFLFTFPSNRASFGRLTFFAVVLLTVPVIGLYFSLAKKSYFSAVLWTLVVGCLFPVLVSVLLGILLPVPEAVGNSMSLTWTRNFPPSSAGNFWALVELVFTTVRMATRYTAHGELCLVLTALLQLANATLYGRRLHRNLERRQFALERGVA